MVGLLLITGMLIIPAAMARNISNNPKQMVLFSIIGGLLSVIIGLFGSLEINTPSGPSIITAALILFCFLFGSFPVFGLEDFQISQSHNFVANVAKKVSPSVVRIDIERDIQTDEFESDLLDPLLRDLLGDLGTFPQKERGQGLSLIHISEPTRPY